MPERWKALLAFVYALGVSWVTAFVMVIVHDRVPDMEKYPPLPDILLGKLFKLLFFYCDIRLLAKIAFGCVAGRS